jgi:hypothetical protein
MATTDERPDSHDEPNGTVRVKIIYCRSETRREEGGKIFACFSDTFGGACSETKETGYEKAALLFPGEAGRCSSGSQVENYTLR